MPKNAPISIQFRIRLIVSKLIYPSLALGSPEGIALSRLAISACSDFGR
jgi:hypothetical protein